MAFTVTIDRNRAEEILKSAACCFSESQGGDLSFLLEKIKRYYSDLWAHYNYLEETF